jgi:hypothetical protein
VRPEGLGNLNWFMNPVARVSINVVEKCTLNCAPPFVAYGGFYTY